LPLFSPPSQEYAARPRSNAGQVANPVLFCWIPRNMYWFRKSIEPVIVSAPGLGSGLAEACAHAGVLARNKVVHTAVISASAFLRIPDIESIHSSAIDCEWRHRPGAATPSVRPNPPPSRSDLAARRLERWLFRHAARRGLHHRGSTRVHVRLLSVC